MKRARMILMVVLMAGVAYAARGDEQSEQEREQLRRDQLHSAVQGICPVSGEKLGAHGPPLKVALGEQKQEIFLCCKACLQQKIDPEHWRTIHANFVTAQRNCPVMKKELPQNPKWTIVDGRIVYVCCPPCIAKITADPESYLKQIDALYITSLKTATKVQ